MIANIFETEKKEKILVVVTNSENDSFEIILDDKKEVLNKLYVALRQHIRKGRLLTDFQYSE